MYHRIGGFQGLYTEKYSKGVAEGIGFNKWTQKI